MDNLPVSNKKFSSQFIRFIRFIQFCLILLKKFSNLIFLKNFEIFS